MANIKFWVPATTTYHFQQGVGDQLIDGSALNKQTTGDVDEAVRVSLNPSLRWRLRCFPSAVTVSHGGIVSVRLHFRIYYSNQGPDLWDNSTRHPYAAGYVKHGTTYGYYWPQGPDIQTNAGVDFDGYGHNWNLPGEPTSKTVMYDATGVVAWDNAKLTACEFGVAMDEVDYGSFPFLRSGLLPQPGHAGNTPRYNVSQCILEVEALEPPPPPTKGMVLNA